MASEVRPASRARGYRQRAHDCIMSALSAETEDARVTLLDLALGWTKMAKQLEKLDPESTGADDLQGVRVLIVKPKPKPKH
jgi:hypothetical protein